MGHAIIDCDIHPAPSADSPVEAYYPDEIRLAIQQKQNERPSHGYANPWGVQRRDVECADLADIRADLLDRYGVSYGVLAPPGLSVGLVHSVPVADGLARAYNDWLIEEFLEKDERLLGSVSINTANPHAAATEIRRVGSHPRMVQVCVSGESEALYGHPMYEPILAACEDQGLVFAMHPGAEGTVSPSTPVGRPRSYCEWHTGISLTFQAQIMNLVFEGVFERHPNLSVLSIEAGISWIGHLMWRMDKNFKALRSTLPWLTRLPSEYILDHVRLATQPLEELGGRADLEKLFELLHAERTLCSSSDYPHWDFDDPYRAFPPGLSEPLQRRIFSENAKELYAGKVAL